MILEDLGNDAAKFQVRHATDKQDRDGTTLYAELNRALRTLYGVHRCYVLYKDISLGDFVTCGNGRCVLTNFQMAVCPQKPASSPSPSSQRSELACRSEHFTTSNAFTELRDLWYMIYLHMVSYIRPSADKLELMDCSGSNVASRGFLSRSTPWSVRRWCQILVPRTCGRNERSDRGNNELMLTRWSLNSARRTSRYTV